MAVNRTEASRVPDMLMHAGCGGIFCTLKSSAVPDARQCNRCQEIETYERGKLIVIGMPNATEQALRVSIGMIPGTRIDGFVRDHSNLTVLAALASLADANKMSDPETAFGKDPRVKLGSVICAIFRKPQRIKKEPYL